MTYIHLNVSNKICDYCGQVLRSKQGLDSHIRSKHQIGQQDEMQCNLCGKWLKNKRGLYKHKYMHQQEASNKKFTCPTCGVEKSTRSKLSGHIRYHHNEKDYICSFCSKQFKCKVSLEVSHLNFVTRYMLASFFYILGTSCYAFGQRFVFVSILFTYLQISRKSTQA